MLKENLQKRIIKFICTFFGSPDIYEILNEGIKREKILEVALRIAIADLSLEDEVDLYQDKFINQRCGDYVQEAVKLLNTDLNMWGNE